MTFVETDCFLLLIIIKISGETATLRVDKSISYDICWVSGAKVFLLPMLKERTGKLEEEIRGI